MNIPNFSSSNNNTAYNINFTSSNNKPMYNINFSNKKSLTSKAYSFLKEKIIGKNIDFKINKIKNNISKKIKILSKSTIIINIKDIIDIQNKIYSNNFIDNFKKKISSMSKINELKNQDYINICMFYIDKFDNYNNKYLVYIYYNNKDLYFIYDSTESETRLYDIGDLSNNINNIPNIINHLITYSGN
jgi:cupin superfamily acireductone dioxygenase involved in methionine salvage